jgi:outer membrane receptor protein involved in Fe transport
MPLNSPGFFTLNAQITRTFMPGLDLYLGVENLFGYRQENLIIDSLNPDSQFFDASMVWGPVTGAMAYAGLRFRM